MRVAIFANAFRSDTMRGVKQVADSLLQRGVEVVLSHELRQEPFGRDFPSVTSVEQQGETVDCALSLGGDGTFLTTASLIGHLDIPILGINYGHLGFLAEMQTDEVEYVLDQLVAGNYTVEPRSMLEISCSSNGKIASPYALNEVAILKQGLSSMITIDSYLDGEVFHQYKADGLLIATPTGSTAYNLSVGGPLLSPQVKAMVLSPVAPHSLSVRPLVIPDDSKIDLKVTSRNGSYMISVDGRSQIISDEITLHIEKSQRVIKVMQMEGHNFIYALKDKLRWGR